MVERANSLRSGPTSGVLDLREQAAHHELALALLSSMPAVASLVGSWAERSHSVLFCGESGVGKGLVAAELVRQAALSGPALQLDARLPGGDLEHQLFGLSRDRRSERTEPRGLLERAAGGAVLVREVQRLPAGTQLRLLRALDSGHVSKPGIKASRRLSARLIATCSEGTERLSPLLRRLRSYTVHLPALRECQSAIPHLVDVLLRRRAPGTRPALAAEVLQTLVRYDWPGNLRELVETIDGLRLAPTQGRLELEALPHHLRFPLLSAAPSASFRERVEDFERRLLAEALQASGWNQTRAARMLRMPLRTLVHKLGSLQITCPGRGARKSARAVRNERDR